MLVYGQWICKNGVPMRELPISCLSVFKKSITHYGPIVYRLGHMPLTHERGVRFPLGLLFFNDLRNGILSLGTIWAPPIKFQHRLSPRLIREMTVSF